METALRALGADVVVGDLTRPADVATALDSVQRMFFSMSLAPSHLEATAIVATVARAVGDLDALVAISQMTVSQMNALSMSESQYQRLKDPFPTWMSRGRRGPSKRSQAPGSDRTSRSISPRWPGGVARIDMTATVDEITGRPAESVEEFVRQRDVFAE